MRIYIASFFNTKERLIPIRRQIEQMGHQVVARWLDESPNPTATSNLVEYSPEFLRRCALRDLVDIKQANQFILDTIDESPRGGREVELGIALVQGLPLWLVGPTRNVFHHLVHKSFKEWEECLAHLSDRGNP